MIQNSSINTMAQASAIMLQAVTAITTAYQEAQEAPKEPEVYNMTSNLFPCVCVAMYETVLSPNNYLEYMNDGDDPYYYTTMDWSDWKTELVKVAQKYIDDNVIDCLQDYGLLKIEADHIWSPKYYNYDQDELCMTITMQQGWQQIMAQKVQEWQDNEAVKKYISTYWRSYSGYVNFMPETLAEVLTEDDEERQLAAYLTLAMLVEGELKPCGEIMDELYYSMTEKFSDYERVNVIDEHYDDECEAEELQQVYANDYEWNQLYWDLAHTIGFKWLHEGPDYLRGKKDSDYEFRPKSDGERLLFWAVENQLTVDDLRRLAAGGGEN